MRFKQFLQEDRASVFAEVRPITAEELRLVKEAKGLTSIIHFAIKQGSKITVPEVAHVRREMAKFIDEFKFLKRTTSEIDAWLAAHEKMTAARANLKTNKDEIHSHFHAMKNAILSGKKDELEKYGKKLKKLIDPIDAHVDVQKKAAHHFDQRYKNSITIFGTTRLLDTLTEADYEKIAAIDTSKPLYTGIDFPFKKLKDDWDYIVYFLTHLTSENEPLQFGADSHEFRTFLRVKFEGNDKFKKLRELMDAYLHSNDKSLVTEILELINAIPAIKEANDKRRNEIHKVYRGVGFGQDAPSEDEVIEEDRREKFVATSSSLYAARNFAMQKGHLEHDDMRRSEVGMIIEYAVDADAVLFDTEVVETKYHESEILIDATKAKVIKIRHV